MSQGRHTRQLHRDQAREMLRTAMAMSHYSNDRLRELACSPHDLANMEKVLADARAAISRAPWSIARGALTREVRRLERALESPGIAA